MTHTAIPEIRGPAAGYAPESDGQTAGTPAAIPAGHARPEPSWSLTQRVGFRFLFAYVVLYAAPFPLTQIPWVDGVAGPYYSVWQKIVPWVASNILHLANPVNMRPSGSGDRLFNWVQAFTTLALAILVAVVWTALARRRKHHATMLGWLTVYLRFFLAVTLLRYGSDKVIPNQFEYVNPVRLTQYFGEAAPGGFAWSFLGFSIPYVIFAGSGELIAGLLLFFRRTTTLGAILGGAVMLNVFMINMSFDVPVKLFAGHLLLFLCVLVALDGDRLVRLLMTNKATNPAPEEPLIRSPRWRRVGIGAAVLFAAWIVIGGFKREVDLLHQFGRLAPKPAINGIFEMESMAKNGAVQPPLMTDSTYWRRLAVGGRGAAIRLATDSLVRYRVLVDSTKRTIAFTGSVDTTRKFTLGYVKSDDGRLMLHGRIGADSVDIQLRRRDEGTFLLVNRGFHWVNEAPLFR